MILELISRGHTKPSNVVRIVPAIWDRKFTGKCNEHQDSNTEDI